MLDNMSAYHDVGGSIGAFRIVVPSLVPYPAVAVGIRAGIGRIESDACVPGSGRGHQSAQEVAVSASHIDDAAVADSLVFSQMADKAVQVRAERGGACLVVIVRSAIAQARKIEGVVEHKSALVADGHGYFTTRYSDGRIRAGHDEILVDRYAWPAQEYLRAA